MKSGIFITARLGSTRLSSKHLLPVKGREIMGYLISRILHEFDAEIKNKDTVLSIVTGNPGLNKPFEKAFPECSVFYGDDDNIPKRHLEAAEHYGIDFIVSVDGDDILCSSKAIRSVYQALLGGEQYVKTSGLPLGLNAWGYSTAFLRESLAKADYALLETGWGRIFDSTRLVDIPFKSRNEDYLRFTLDYEADLEFFREIIEQKGININEISDEELVGLVFSKKIYQKNESIAREYWDNFKKNIEKEEKKKN
jgi:spore coat polysaccharide biosynthesis protein SpsF